MKVKCVKLFDNSGKENKESSWLSIGKEYVVLEIESYPGKNILYRLVGDNEDESPALYDARQFKIISSVLPSSWTIHQVNNLIVQGPKSWQKSGFWEECYEHEPQALALYKFEAEAIYKEEG